MEELIKSIYVEAVSNELSADDFFQLYQDGILGAGVSGYGVKNDLTEKCLRRVTEILKVTIEELKQNPKSRVTALVLGRQWHIFMLKRVSGLSYSSAAGHYSKDHSTAIHTIKRICNLKNYNKFFRNEFKDIIDQLEEFDEDIFKYEGHGNNM